MHTGKELGEALREAMRRKGVRQHHVADAFEISQPSVSEWLKYGRISKRHITRLVEYFADVAGPEHWGLPATWGTEVPAAQPADQHQIQLSPDERDLVLAFRDLPQKKAKELLSHLMLEAEEFRQYGASVLARFGASGVVSNERAAEALPPAPTSNVKQFTPPSEGGLLSSPLRVNRPPPAQRSVVLNTKAKPAPKKSKESPHGRDTNRRVEKPRDRKPPKGSPGPGRTR